MSSISDKIRHDFKTGDDIRDAGLTTPEDVVRYDDICYGTDETWQIMDIYLPKSFVDGRKAAEEKIDLFDSDIQGSGSVKKLPVIVSVHGGAWVYGTKETYQFYCMSLAQRGFAVVNFTYRLAPEFKFPASVEDTNLVMKYVFDNADKYGFDTDRIYAVGDSAGAHILTIYTAILTDQKYASRYDFKIPEGFSFKAVALNCGKYSFRIDDRIFEGGDKALLEEFLSEHGTDSEMELINIIDYVNPAFPPVFVMTASDDFLKGQSVLLAGKLVEEKVPFTFKCYGSADHPLYHVFHCDTRSADAARCNDDECGFFSSIL